MEVHRKFGPGLVESAYEAALKYLMEKSGFKVDRQVYLPIFWDDVRLDQTYRLDLVVNDDVICELKAVSFVSKEHRRQLWSYMRITKRTYGMIINFGSDSLYSEWYHLHESGEIEKVTMI